MDLVYSRAMGPHWADVLIAEITLAWLKECLGKTPHNYGLFARALTHGSMGQPDYQRLEFLGDRVLGLVIAEMLYERYPEEAEGRLSHRLNSLVAGLTCAAIARDIGVSQHLNLGKQAKDDGAQESDKVLGDVVESIIGALYLDQGLDAARGFIIKHWTGQIEAASGVPKHPKSTLQEWCAANDRKMPEYIVTKKEGPPHAMQFEVTVTVKGLTPASANANSKQAAETAAALCFLEMYT